MHVVVVLLIRAARQKVLHASFDPPHPTAIGWAGWQPGWQPGWQLTDTLCILCIAMSTWFTVKQVTFRVRVDGKGVQEKKVDLDNPAVSLEELETKSGLVCPEDRKRELLASIHPTTGWSDGVTVPEWYNDASKEDISTALRVGCELVVAQKQLGEDKLRDQSDAKWSRELAESRADLERYKQDVERQILQKDREIQTWQQTAVSNLTASGVDEKIQTLKKEWAEEQRLILSAVERERLSLTGQVEYLRGRTSDLEQMRETMQEKLDQKATRDALMNKSVHKGGVGEQLVDTWLRTAFLGADIINTSKIEGQMDRRMIWDGMTIVIDAKNHDSKLHSLKDVKKFHTDLQSNDAQIGILLCTNIVVPNHNRFWVETEYINDKLAIYMNNVSENPIERLQLVAGTVLQPWKEYLAIKQAMADSAVGDELKTWSDSAKRVLTNGWTLIMKIHAHWTKTHSTVTASLAEFRTELDTVAQEMKDDLASISIAVDTPAKKNRRSKA